MNLLNLKNIEKHFKHSNFKLNIDNLNIKQGEIVGLVGENGSGKSTIINLIAGNKIYDSGTISFFESKKNDKNNLSFVLDDACFPKMINIYQLNNCFNHIYTYWDSEKFFEYIEKFDIPKKQHVKHLSKGMMAKLSLSIALSHKSKLLILDEATSGLDVTSREVILQEIKDYVLKNNSGALITSHIGHDIDYISGKIYFIKNGEIISKIHKREFYDGFCYLKLTNKDFKYFYQQNRQNIYAYYKNGDFTEVILRNQGNKENIKDIDIIIKILLKGVILK
ncbi:ABC transporter ATP-binding protein [Staphylococcus pseudintermedius]|uniref:ABC transporter ATP-binding protein n=1 Tax=Staphylococcus pseudintermedius TaxID=283734 RepID=UPI002EDAD39B